MISRSFSCSRRTTLSGPELHHELSSSPSALASGAEWERPLHPVGPNDNYAFYLEVNSGLRSSSSLRRVATTSRPSMHPRPVAHRPRRSEATTAKGPARPGAGVLAPVNHHVHAQLLRDLGHAHALVAANLGQAGPGEHDAGGRPGIGAFRIGRMPTAPAALQLVAANQDQQCRRADR